VILIPKDFVDHPIEERNRSGFAVYSREQMSNDCHRTFNIFRRPSRQVTTQDSISNPILENHRAAGPHAPSSEPEKSSS
jgi:hypothetical protein